MHTHTTRKNITRKHNKQLRTATMDIWTFSLNEQYELYQKWAFRHSLLASTVGDNLSHNN